MRYLAPKVGWIEGIDPSNAVVAATENLRGFDNARVTHADLSAVPFPQESFDLVYAIGVLHHMPNTADAMRDCVRFVRPGGAFIVYLYYALDNRGVVFRMLFGMADVVRRVVSRLPSGLKNAVCDVIAVVAYMPFVLLARAVTAIAGYKTAERLVPLAYYSKRSFLVE